VEAVTVTSIAPRLAASMLAGAERYDPRGVMRADDVQAMCERGLCFAATVNGSQGVYVLHVKNGQAWVQAGAGFGAADLTRAVLPAIELQVAGYAESVAFQTMRPGLVRKAEALGYRRVGWILKKDLQC
jgi:hypothetical protein